MKIEITGQKYNGLPIAKLHRATIIKSVLVVSILLSALQSWFVGSLTHLSSEQAPAYKCMSHVI